MVQKSVELARISRTANARLSLLQFDFRPSSSDRLFNIGFRALAFFDFFTDTQFHVGIALLSISSSWVPEPGHALLSAWPCSGRSGHNGPERTSLICNPPSRMTPDWHLSETRSTPCPHYPSSCKKLTGGMITSISLMSSCRRCEPLQVDPPVVRTRVKYSPRIFLTSNWLLLRWSRK